jgi:hypothetical protein
MLEKGALKLLDSSPMPQKIVGNILEKGVPKLECMPLAYPSVFVCLSVCLSILWQSLFSSLVSLSSPLSPSHTIISSPSLFVLAANTSKIFNATVLFEMILLSVMFHRFEDQFEESMARFYMAEMVLAIHSLHTMGYVHRYMGFSFHFCTVFHS